MQEQPGLSSASDAPRADCRVSPLGALCEGGPRKARMEFSGETGYLSVFKCWPKNIFYILFKAKQYFCRQENAYEPCWLKREEQERQRWGHWEACLAVSPGRWEPPGPSHRGHGRHGQRPLVPSLQTG